MSQRVDLWTLLYMKKSDYKEANVKMRQNDPKKTMIHRMK
jgi:hypothetical protein